jgi:protein TonB
MFLLFIVFISAFSYSQSDTLDCSELYRQFLENNGHRWVDKLVEPIGGIEAIEQKLIYPKEASENNIEGRVYVTVIIDSTGKLICPKVLKGLGYGCDEEALRIVTDTRFTPTVCKGNPITSTVTLPIRFKVQH